MNGSSSENDDNPEYGLLLEPTPLSEIVQCQHMELMRQKRVLELQQYRCSEIDAMIRRGMKRKRVDRSRVDFCPHVWEYDNPRELEEIVGSWYTVCYVVRE